MNNTSLYKRDARNNIIVWKIKEDYDGSIVIEHGLLNHSMHVEIITPTLKKVNEIESRIKAKRKEGYKTVEDLYDNAPFTIDNQLDLYNYLNTYLPKYNTTSEGFVLPMLAKTLEDNKPFEKFGIMLGQWKINGLRCIVGAEKVEGNLFTSYKFTYTSREGTRWDLDWMDEIIKDNISEHLIASMIDEGICLDGELYLPGYSVNDINSFVKNKNLPQHYKLQYWWYDITIEGMSAMYRNSLIERSAIHGVTTIFDKSTHLNNTSQFITLPTYDIDNISIAIERRNMFIHYGFEGLILRNPHAEYAFGKRNSSMFKFKKKEDGLFEIVDIKTDKRGLPIYVLKNDINSELFECTLNKPHAEQKLMLNNKEDIISNYLAMVEYRERSGKAFVPFHAKIVKLLKN